MTGTAMLTESHIVYLAAGFIFVAMLALLGNLPVETGHHFRTVVSFDMAMATETTRDAAHTVIPGALFEEQFKTW